MGLPPDERTGTRKKYLDLVALYEEYQEWMTKDDDEDVEVMSITKIDLDDDENYGWYD